MTADDLLALLRRAESTYEVSSPSRVLEPPRIQQLASAFSNDVHSLERCFASSDVNARIFALHSLSLARAEDSDLVYGRWLTAAAEATDPRILWASFYYVHLLNNPPRVPYRILHGFLADREPQRTWATLLAVRNGSILPQFTEASHEPFSLFEDVLSTMIAKSTAVESERETTDWAHEILEDLTSQRFRRARKVVASVPLPESGPFFTAASSEAQDRKGHWENWWRKHKHYLVWIPLRQERRLSSTMERRFLDLTYQRNLGAAHQLFHTFSGARARRRNLCDARRLPGRSGA